ncbi:hypothetical protein [Candidatus Albibeggiatoa sp. nov. NOAA]|uniref:hypothetical protein n=1 Tax=Candidatus Albibeggiatoa sp. nov. NOAA TaxID=3162724 RepID=UPI0032F0F478|nr:hypothetical protein [Thiotrichaceae bacterium]
MVVDFEKLNELKQQLIKATDFRDPLNYFFDHLSASREFVEKGERIEHSLIEQVIAQVGQQLFGTQAQVDKLLLSEIEEYQFIHGTCFVSGHVVNILFFNDIDMGLLGIAMEDDKIMTARFSSATLSAASDKAFYVPNASNAIH